MSVDKRISLGIIKEELEVVRAQAGAFGWQISPIDEDRQQFTVAMISPIDREPYILLVQFDNYRQWPLLLEFLHPVTREPALHAAYPKNGDSFFHGKPCICNPCSRKSYKEYTNVHGDWQLEGWESNPQLQSLKNLVSILQAIYFRISSPDLYTGRMTGERFNVTS